MGKIYNRKTSKCLHNFNPYHSYCYHLTETHGQTGWLSRLSRWFIGCYSSAKYGMLGPCTYTIGKFKDDHVTI